MLSLVVQIISALSFATLSASWQFTGEGFYVTHKKESEVNSCLHEDIDLDLLPISLNSVQYKNGYFCGACIKGCMYFNSGKSHCFNGIVSDECLDCGFADIEIGATGVGKFITGWSFVPCPGKLGSEFDSSTNARKLSRNLEKNIILPSGYQVSTHVDNDRPVEVNDSSQNITVSLDQVGDSADDIEHRKLDLKKDITLPNGYQVSTHVDNDRPLEMNDSSQNITVSSNQVGDSVDDIEHRTLDLTKDVILPSGYGVSAHVDNDRPVEVNDLYQNITVSLNQVDDNMDDIEQRRLEYNESTEKISRFLADEVVQCVNGIANENVCCPILCKICGGDHCKVSPGGSHMCCPEQILKSNRSCLTMSPPCIIQS